MAKQIKALKCPQCGSTKKQELKEDHYICNNCGTEYFLDNDDINVNVRYDHNYPTYAPEFSANRRKLFVFIAVIAALSILLPVLFGLFSRNSSGRKSNILPGTAKTETRERIKTHFVLDGEEGNPIVIFFMERSYYRRNLDKPADYLLRFYDPIKGETVNDIEMKEWNDKTALYYHRFFSDGNFYIIPKDETTIYKIDGVRQTITSVNEGFFESVPEFNSGIASLEFRSRSYGDGLEIMTNDGTQYYYYPLARQVFKGRDELSAAYDKLVKDHTMPEKVYFAFTGKSTDYREEKIQLIKYWYREKAGFPVQLSTSPSWRKKYNYPKGSGIFVGNFTYEKILFEKTGRVSKFEDLTPDRLYFESKIVSQSSDELYITGYPTANINGSKFLQRIDVNTGEVLWNYKSALADYDFRNDFYKFKNGIAFNVSGKENGVHQNKLVFLGSDGKLIKEINLHDLFK
ncbi:hypothetical protein [Sphingobacterium gobiense]|uniref:Uncharacterized protein n=1 Tax=Sphingobacterium gobiense TaxID=1382456 RepID=A0A2S9JUY2_9SPHI|nr:hypothetical protein [Sphingobacterium gobiense]PRD57094.1 hypothetical protein C5749_07775 [Sphingobacterium gobiense]